MRSVFTIAIKGIFKRKTYTIAILFLTAIAAVGMATALGTIFRVHDIYRDAYEKSNSPDMLYFFRDPNYTSADADFFRQRDEVEKVVAQSGAVGMSHIGTINGESLSSCFFYEYKPREGDFELSSKKTDKVLLDNEVYAPLVFKDLFHAKIGDELIIPTSQGDKKYTIAGFFEDPVFGSTLMGIKRILFSTDGFSEIKALTIGKTTAESTLLCIYFKHEYQGSSQQTAENLNIAFGRDTSAIFQFSKAFLNSAVLAVPQIVSVVLLCFSALLILIVTIVIRHSVLSSIEADYVSLGVLKAIGFTGKNVILAITLQYLLISAVGTFVGVVGAIFTTPSIGDVLLHSIGILWSGNLSVPVALSVTAAILIVIGFISYLSARKTAKISPVMAISFGKSPVHFSSRMNLPLERLGLLPLSLKMSLKQMTTKLKQYTTLIVITTVFMFMLTTTITLTNNFGTVENVVKVSGFGMYDMIISSGNPSVCSAEHLDEIVDEIDKTYGIKTVTSDSTVKVQIDTMSVSGLVKSSFDGIKDSVISGVLPEFDNEIGITPIVSKALNKGVGDTVVLKSKNGSKEEYIISCINQCLNEMGNNISMPVTAYQRIVPDYQQLDKSIILEDSSDLDGTIAALKHKYETIGSGLSIINYRTSASAMTSSVQSAIALASSLIYVLTFVLIACITVLLCAITIYREITDTGIFKALGFKTIELRLQFTFRFMLIAITGSLLGIALSLLLNEPLLGAMLSSAGIANLKPAWNFSTLGFPLLFIVAVTGITAFLCSARIKGIHPSSLISE